MDSKLRNPLKNIPTSRSKEVQRRNTAPNEDIASKYQLRNVYVSLQRLASTDVEKWNSYDDVSKKSVEMLEFSKNDDKLSVRNRKSNQSIMKKSLDRNKSDSNIVDMQEHSAVTVSDSPLEPHPSEQGGTPLKSRRSSLRNATSHLVLPSTSHNSKTVPLKDDPNENISSSSSNVNTLSTSKANRSKSSESQKLSTPISSNDVSSTENISKNTENLSSNNHLEKIVHNLRSKTISTDENNFPLPKKSVTSNIDNAASTKASNKLKTSLDQEENDSEHKIILKKVRKISESEKVDRLENVESISSSCDSSNVSHVNDDSKTSRRMKSKPVKNHRGTNIAPNALNKSFAELPKEKRRISKEYNLPQEEPRLLRSSTVKSDKLEDRTPATDHSDSPYAPTSTDFSSKTNIGKDKINISDERKNTMRSSDTDLIEPRLLRSSNVKQTLLPSVAVTETDDKNKTSDSLFDDKPESLPLSEQTASPSSTDASVVLLNEIKTSPKKISAEDTQISKVSENSSIQNDSKTLIRIENVGNLTENCSKEIEPRTILNTISDLGNQKLENITENRESDEFRLVEESENSESISENKTMPFKKEIPLFETSLAASKVHGKKGKRKLQITKQFELQNSSKIEVNIGSTSLESTQTNKVDKDNINPLSGTAVDKMNNSNFSGKASDNTCSVIEVNVPTTLEQEHEKGNATSSSTPKDKQTRSSGTVSNSNKPGNSTRRKDPVAKDFKNLNSVSLTELKNNDTESIKESNNDCSEISSSVQSEKVNEGKVNRENLDDIHITETASLTTPKKLRKYSLNTPHDDGKTCDHPLTTREMAEAEISVSRQNVLNACEKVAETVPTKKRSNLTSKDLNDLNTSLTNIVSEDQLPIVEAKKQETLRNVTCENSKPSATSSKSRRKSSNKKRNSLSSSSLLTNSSKECYSNATNNDSLTDQVATKDLITEKIDLNKDNSLPVEKLPTPKKQSNRTKKEHTPLNGYTEKLFQETPNDLTKEKINNCCSPGKKLPSTRQLSKRAVKGESPASKTGEVSEQSPQATTKDDEFQLKKASTMQVNKLSSKKPKSKGALKEVFPHPDSSNDLIKEKVDLKKDRSLSPKKLSTPRKQVKSAGKHETHENEAKAPEETTDNLLNKEVNLKKDRSLSPKKLSIPRKQVKSAGKHETHENETKAPEETTDNLLNEEVNLKKDRSLSPKKLSTPKKQMKSAGKHETHENETKAPEETTDNLLNEEVNLKKDRSLSSKKLSTPRKQMERAGKQETHENEAKAPQETTDNLLDEEVNSKEDNSSVRKSTSRQHSKRAGEQETSEKEVKELSQLIPSKTTDNLLNEEVNLKEDSLLPVRKSTSRQHSKRAGKQETSEKEVKELTQLIPSESTDNLLNEEVNLKEDSSLPERKSTSRQYSKRAGKQETSEKEAKELSQLIPSETTDNLSKEKVNTKKGGSLPVKKLSTPKQQLKRNKKEQTPSENENQLIPSESTDNLLNEEVNLKEDSSLLVRKSTSRQHSKRAGKQETSEKEANELTQLIPSESTDNLLNEEVNLKEDSSLPERKSTSRQYSKRAGKQETSEKEAKELSQLIPSETTDNLTKEKVNTKKGGSLPVKKLSTPKQQLKRNKKEQTPSENETQLIPSESTDNLLNEEVNLKEDSSLLVRKSTSRQHSKRAGKQETSEKEAKEVSQLILSESTDNLLNEEVNLKEDSSLPERKSISRQHSKRAGKQETSEKEANELTQLIPSESTDNLTKEKVNTKKGGSLPVKKLSTPKQQLKRNKKEQTPSENETAELIPQAISKDLISQKVETNKDNSLPAKRLSTPKLPCKRGRKEQTPSNELAYPHISTKSEKTDSYIDGTIQANLSTPRQQPKRAVRQDTPTNNTNVPAEFSPETSSTDLINEKADSVKDVSLPAKTVLHPRQQPKRAVKQDTPTNNTNIPAEFSPETSSTDLINEKADSVKDISLPAKTVLHPRQQPKRAVKQDTPTNNTNVPAEYSPETSSADLINEKADSVKDVSLPPKTVLHPRQQPKRVVKQDTPTNNTNVPAECSPETSSADLINEKADSVNDVSLPPKTLLHPRQQPKRVVKQDTPTNNTNVPAEYSPETSSADLINEKADAAKNIALPANSILSPRQQPKRAAKQETPTNNINVPAELSHRASTADLINEKADAAKDIALLPPRQQPKRAVKQDTPSNNTKVSGEFSPQTTTADLMNEKADSVKDISLPANTLLPPRQQPKRAAKHEPPTNNTNLPAELSSQTSTDVLPRQQPKRAVKHESVTNNANRPAELSSQTSTDVLPRQQPKRAVKHESVTNNANRPAELSPQTSTNNLINDETDSVIDNLLPTNTVLTRRQQPKSAVKQETLVNNANIPAELSSHTSTDLINKKIESVENSSLPANALLTPRQLPEHITKQDTPSNSAIIPVELSPQTSTDGIALKEQPKRAVKQETTANNPNIPAELSKAESVRDISFVGKRTPSTGNGTLTETSEIIVSKDASLITSNEMTMMPPTQIISNDFRKRKINSKEGISLPYKKRKLISKKSTLPFRIIPPSQLPVKYEIVIEDIPMNCSGENSITPPTQVTRNALIEEKVDLKLETSLPSKPSFSKMISIIEKCAINRETALNILNEIAKRQPSLIVNKKIIKQNFDEKQDTSLSNIKLSSPTQLDKSAETPSTTSRELNEAKINNDLSKEKLSLKKNETTPSKDVQKISNDELSQQTTSDNLIKCASDPVQDTSSITTDKTSLSPNIQLSNKNVIIQKDDTSVITSTESLKIEASSSNNIKSSTPTKCTPSSPSQVENTNVKVQKIDLNKESTVSTATQSLKNEGSSTKKINSSKPEKISPSPTRQTGNTSVKIQKTVLNKDNSVNTSAQSLKIEGSSTKKVKSSTPEKISPSPTRQTGNTSVKIQKTDLNKDNSVNTSAQSLKIEESSTKKVKSSTPEKISHSPPRPTGNTTVKMQNVDLNKNSSVNTSAQSLKIEGSYSKKINSSTPEKIPHSPSRQAGDTTVKVKMQNVDLNKNSSVNTSTESLKDEVSSSKKLKSSTAMKISPSQPSQTGNTTVKIQKVDLNKDSSVNTSTESLKFEGSSSKKIKSTTSDKISTSSPSQVGSTIVKMKKVVINKDSSINTSAQSLKIEGNSIKKEKPSTPEKISTSSPSRGGSANVKTHKVDPNKDSAINTSTQSLKIGGSSTKKRKSLTSVTISPSSLSQGGSTIVKTEKVDPNKDSPSNASAQSRKIGGSSTKKRKSSTSVTISPSSLSQGGSTIVKTEKVDPNKDSPSNASAQSRKIGGSSTKKRKSSTSVTISPSSLSQGGSTIVKTEKVDPNKDSPSNASAQSLKIGGSSTKKKKSSALVKVSPSPTCQGGSTNVKVEKIEPNKRKKQFKQVISQGDIFLTFRYYSHKPMTSIKVKSFFKRLATATFSKSISTQTDDDPCTNSMNLDSSYPSSPSPSTNHHSLEVIKDFHEANYQNSSSVSNDQPSDNKRKLNQDASNLLSKKKKMDDASVFAIKDVNYSAVQHDRSVNNEQDPSNTSKITLGCSSCQTPMTYVLPKGRNEEEEKGYGTKAFNKMFYQTHRRSSTLTSSSSGNSVRKLSTASPELVHSSSETVSKNFQQLKKLDKSNSPVQSTINSNNTPLISQTPMVIEMVSKSFYKSVVSTSDGNSQVNKTVDQTENLSVDLSVISNEPEKPDVHVFKVPIKAPPRAKNKIMTKSETFLKPKGDELEVGTLVKTSFGLAVKSGGKLIVLKDIPKEIRFSLGNTNKIYFRRKLICDPSKSQNKKESVTKEIFNKNSHGKSKEKTDDDGDNISFENFIKDLRVFEKSKERMLTDGEYSKYNQMERAIVKLNKNRDRITPLTNDLIMSRIISKDRLKAVVKSGKFKNKLLDPLFTKKLVTIKDKKSSNQTVEDILRMSGHEFYPSTSDRPNNHKKIKLGQPHRNKSASLHSNKKTISVTLNQSRINKNGTKQTPQNCNEEKFNLIRDARTLERKSSKLQSEQFNKTKKVLNNPSSPNKNSVPKENGIIADENSNTAAENNPPKSSHLGNYISQLYRLDESIVNAGNNYKSNVKTQKVNEELRVMIPKDGFNNELPERPPEWFLRFVTKFRKQELWRLHNLFKVHDNLRRIESAKVCILEKMYERLMERGLSDTDDERNEDED